MLKSLHIKNFRMLRDFQVPQLGNINLIVGKNNSGKSSVLEALRIYAGNGSRDVLEDIALQHDEMFRVDSSESQIKNAKLPFESFFSGWRFPDDQAIGIVIGEGVSDKSSLTIRKGLIVGFEESPSEFNRIIWRELTVDVMEEAVDNNLPTAHSLFVSKGDSGFRIRLDGNSRLGRIRPGLVTSEITPTIPVSVIPTQFITLDELADEWDKVVLTDYEGVVTDALSIVAPEIEKIAFVKNDGYQNERRSARKGIIKLKEISDPIPFKSMGDGVLRVFQLVVKAFQARDGFLLIDEFENGLHYKIQTEMWNLLFKLSADLNIQIFATTHSFDCVKSFAEASGLNPDISSVAFRVGKSIREKDSGRVIATLFDKIKLKSFAEMDLDIR